MDSDRNANLGRRPDEQGLRSRICDRAPEITRERVIRGLGAKTCPIDVDPHLVAGGNVLCRTMFVSTRS
jgi:hypothetical protein